MKKLLFSVAILAVAASCSKNEVTDVAVSSQNEIGFATLNNLTRSANDDSQMYQVYAAQEGVTGAWYIEDVSVSDVALKNTYYWPADGSYLDFYAYAPYTATTASVTAATSIIIAYTVPTTADEDFTIAEPVKGATENTVDFVFAHQLSKATVEVVLDEDLEKAGYVLSFTKDVAAAAAVYEEGYDADSDPTGDHIVTPAVVAVDGAEVTLSVFGTSATYDVMAKSVIYPDVLPTTLTPYTTDYEENYFIFMPQAAAGCTISVTGVTITDNSGKNIIENATLGLYTIKSTDLTSFVQNYNYAITLTIDESSVIDGPSPIFGDAIAFTANTKVWSPTTLGLGTDNQPEVTD